MHRSVPLIAILLAILALLTGPGRAWADTGAGGQRAQPEAAIAAPQPPPSRLEAAFSARAGEDLRQYGYDLFDAPAGRAEPALGAVADDHVLGPGDVLSLVLRGQTSAQQTYEIGSDGLLVADELRPVMAAGRRLGEVRAEVEAEVAARLFDTRAYLSLARPRRLSVLVLGEVARPGRHDLSAFSTVLDALFAAGGVRRTGSLRSIRLVAPGQPDGVAVDLYELLHQGRGGADARLGDGARIVVPPVGPTMAAAGSVQRPGIYELPPDGSPLSADDLVGLAGGPLRPGPIWMRVAGIAPDGSERVRDVADPARPLASGDILLTAPARSDLRQTVRLLGHVRTGGPRPLAAGGEMSSLLARDALMDDAYLPFGVRVGIDPVTGARLLDPIHPGRILAGRTDGPLSDGDGIVVFGPQDIAFLSSGPVLALLRTGPVAADGAGVDACPGLDALAARLAADGPDGPFAGSAPLTAAVALTGPDLPCPPLFRDQPDLLPHALQHALLIRRGVLRPGLYPAGPDAALAELVRAAGGADLPGGEPDVVGPHTGAAAGSAGRVLDSGAAAVMLEGAVRDPGRRTLDRAPSLRALLSPRHTLSDDAYGLFAVLERVDRQRLTRTTYPFMPAEVLSGLFDRRLEDGDRVVIFTRDELRSIVDPSTAPDDDPRAAADRFPIVTPDLLGDHVAWVRGQVMQPGAYPIAAALPPGMLVAAAGGLAVDADPSAVEILSRAPDMADPIRLVRLDGGGGEAAVIRPGDSLRVPRRGGPPPGPGIDLTGEVRQPGRYDLAPGEKLSSVIARAGGLLPSAYAEGAVFTRDSARQAEQQGLERAAEELDRSMALMLLRPDPPDAARVELARRLSDELRAARAMGRITVEADPAVLAARPEMDIVLEPGDLIHFPRRPLTITVSGEVLAPASLQYLPGKDVGDYVDEAGGPTRQADESRIFVLLPDGSARSADALSGRHGVAVLPPGSSIVVPRDPEPYAFLDITQSVATILSQLALTAAAVTTLAD